MATDITTMTREALEEAVLSQHAQLKEQQAYIETLKGRLQLADEQYETLSNVVMHVRTTLSC